MIKWIGIIISVIAIAISCSAYNLSKKVFIIQNTPRLSAKIGDSAYVGRIPNRVDDVVVVPLAVYNNSATFAHDIILDLLYSDGTGRKTSLNEYFKSVPLPIMRKERLTAGEPWLLSPKAVSVFPNAKQIYLSGERIFKAKLQLSWKDVDGKEYRYVELAELTPVKSVEGITEAFWFDSKGSFSSIDNPNEVNKHWGMEFNF